MFNKRLKNELRLKTKAVPTPSIVLYRNRNRTAATALTDVAVKKDTTRDTTQDIKNILLELDEVKRTLDEFNKLNRKGYVVYREILNSDIYPAIVSKMVKYLNTDVDKGGVDKLEDLDDRALLCLIKWSYNDLLLEQHLKVFSNLKKGLLDDDNDVDWHLKLREITSRLDTSIRLKIEKRGITISKNIYTGYDSEYQQTDSINNKLVSIQLAVCGRLIIKIPIQEKYVVSKINTLSNEKYDLFKDSRILFNSLENNINENIDVIRSKGYYKNDKSLDVIVKGLKDRGIPHIYDKECIIFTLERLPIKQWFYKADKKGFSLNGIVNQSTKMMMGSLDERESVLYDELRDIFNAWVHSNSYTGEEEVTNKVEGYNIEVVDNNNNNNNNIEEGNNKEDVNNNKIEDVNNDDDNNNNDVNNDDKNKNKIYTIEPTKITVKELEESCELNNNNNTSLSLKDKKYTRTWRSSFTDDKVSITIMKNNYIIGHFTPADLSILSDYNEYKDQLSIVNNSYITLNKPIQFGDVRVSVRDTMLLAPGPRKGLGDIGKMYGEYFNKISIDKDWLHKMDMFYEKEPVKFKEYAMRDALIALIHALYMEDFNMSLGSIGVPITLSSLTATNIRNKWKNDGYKGYQLSTYLMSEPNEIQTPRGLESGGHSSLNLSMYIINYKGGRNEIFMYGKDSGVWYDYDISSAYTTAMSLLGDPEYRSSRRLVETDILEMTDYELIFSYVIIKVSFKFPKDTKYPSIPCKVDETTTLYPLEGESYLTGIEYVLAKNQGCTMFITDGFIIPFKGAIDDKKRNNLKAFLDSNGYKPFRNCISELQKLRSVYSKDKIENLIYKELGNSLYGLVSKGISNKKKFDTKIGKPMRVKSNDLSNPVLASWITSFIRCVIGELLHNIDKMGGKVISVTTDGFITDVEELESKIMNPKIVKSSNSKILLGIYRSIREKLVDDACSLELKGVNKGILSWTTRGQFGSVTKATTGLQRKYYNYDELDNILNKTFESDSKEYGYIQKSLRSGLDIYKHGGSVTSVFKDRVFRMITDNRRLFDDGDDVNCLKGLVDSKPMKDIDQCALNRYVNNLPKSKIYHKTSAVGNSNTKYRGNLDIAVKAFIRGLFSNEYNINRDDFSKYKDIIDFVKGFKPDYKITENNIALLKHRSVNHRKIPVDSDVKDFVDYVCGKYPKFNKDFYLDNLD